MKLPGVVALFLTGFSSVLWAEEAPAFRLEEVGFVERYAASPILQANTGSAFSLEIGLDLAAVRSMPRVEYRSMPPGRSSANGWRNLDGPGPGYREQRQHSSGPVLPGGRGS